MLVTPEHILAGIKEAQLWTFLIVFPFNFRVGKLLKIELSRLDDRLAHWQNLVNQPHGFEMHRDFVFDGRGKPALRLFSIEKPASPIPGFALPPRMAKLSADCKHLLQIGSWLHFCLEQHSFFVVADTPICLVPASMPSDTSCV